MGSNVYGIDPGTCNLKVFSQATGKIYNEKNTVAIINEDTLYAFGNEAYAMFEKVPENIQVSFPVNVGVISSYNYEQAMIFEFLEKHSKGRIKGAEFIVAVPTDITEVEKKAFFDLLYKSKAKPRSVLVCDKPIASAVGLGLDVNEPTGVMIVDMGADTTEISVISLGGLVISSLLDFGGNRIDESIISCIRKEFNLLIGKKTACQLKETIGSALPGYTDEITVVGRDVVSGLPIEMTIAAEVIYKAITPDLEEFCSNIKLMLEHVPPELARDVVASGIYLTGGTSKIRGVDQLFSDVSGIRVNLCENPEESAARGLVKIVSDPKYRNLPYTMKARNIR